MNTHTTTHASSHSGRTTRRSFLRASSMGATLLASWGLTSLLSSCTPPSTPDSAPGAGAAQSVQNDFVPDLELTLTAKPDEASLLPGASTQVWRYEGERLQGRESVLQAMEGYLGPVIRSQRGEKVRINFKNELDEESVIHWHGLIVPEEMDGHPRFAIAPGETYIYEFEVQNRAGTYWFHPHPHGRTGAQVYRGLAGLFLVSDDEEAALDLPDGEYDIPLVIQDRLFDAENQLVYQAGDAAPQSGHGMGGMNHGNMGRGMNGTMAQMMGQRGDRILVNGEVDATLSVATRAYRLRLINGSNSRIYKLAWGDGTPLTVIGSDGGLLTEPVQKPYVALAPGERIELWADFSAYAVGSELQLSSLAFTGMEMGTMMDGMMGTMEDDPLPSGTDFDVLRVRVEREESEMRTLPARLSQIEHLDPEEAANATSPYRVELFMENMAWTLNGRTFDMEAVTQAEQMPLNALALWDFVNVPGRGMMADFMAHPMHIHGVQFQVVEREVDPQYREGWQSLNKGYVDEGWKDTVLVMPGERVRVLMRFTEPGLFVYHCHILEHEDIGMMRNILVGG